MEIWKFETERFCVKFEALPEYDLDLSWDDTGEISDGIERDLYVVFCAKVSVELDGQTIGADYLGQCIYESAGDFIDHRGMNSAGHGSYFSDMVREAIREARETLENTPKMRGAA